MSKIGIYITIKIKNFYVFFAFMSINFVVVIMVIIMMILNEQEYKVDCDILD